MNVEKMLSPFNTNILLHQAFALLPFKEVNKYHPSVYFVPINTAFHPQKKLSTAITDEVS